jgi:Nucleotidyl transferase AbiEii toxin, Type IV TA system
MRNIFEEAFLLQQFLLKNNFLFCFIGGLALQRWGDLRTTNDIDLTLLTGFEGEDRFIDKLLESYEARIPLARETALSARVLLLRSPSGVGIDIALGGLPFEESSINRSSESEFLPGIFLRTCSAEDLVVHKAFAARPKDWIDIEGILLRQETLDWGYIEKQLKPLLDLKEEPEHWSALEDLRKKLNR